MMKRSLRIPLLGATMVALVSGLLVAAAVTASASPVYTFPINSTAFGGADANPGDGACRTATGVCTLRAAIQESNALNRPAGEVLITVDQSIPLNTPMTGDFNLVANFMYTGRVTRLDGYAQYHVTAPATIDLGHRLRPDASSNDNNENAMFYLTGQNIEILNADQVLSSGASFVVGPNAEDITIDGDTMGMNSGFGQVATVVSYNPERFLVTMQGAQNVTVRNYKVSGYYNSVLEGGVFVFSNTSDSAPARPTRNFVVDRVNVNYPSGGQCDGSHGEGCKARITSFWQYSAGGDIPAGWANNVIDKMTFNDFEVTNLPDGTYAMNLAAPSLTPNNYTADITDLTITNSRFLRVGTPNTDANYPLLMLPFAGNLHGTTTITDNVFVSNHATGNQTGQRTAIYFAGSQAAGSTSPSGVTISNNYFNGFGGYSTIRLRAVGLATVSGNTFGPSTVSQGTSRNEETADYPVMFSNTPTSAAPYRSTNESVLTWFPSAAASVASAVPGPDTLVMADPRAGASTTCPATVTVEKPTTNPNSSQYTIPGSAPVTLQAYWTSGQTAELYLGEVSGVTGTSQKVAFPLPVGPVTLPDGTVRTVVSETSGAVSGYVRFQTQVEGRSSSSSQLESSQYSRTVAVSGSCRPALTINQAVGMADPTYARDLHFTLRSTMALDPETLTVSDFGLAAVAVPATIDAARLNPRIVSVRPVEGSENTAFDVIVRVDDSAKVTLTLGANAVATPAGLTNQNSASWTDNEITFLNPLQVNPPAFTVVTGEPSGETFTIGIAPGAPLPQDDLSFDASVSQPAGTPEIRLSTTGPILRAGGTSTDPVRVTAVEGEVAANTPATISFDLTCSDPNYDGLVVPSVAPRLFSTDPTIRITKTAWVDVTDTSTPGQIRQTGTLAPKGQRLMDGELVCFIYTVTNTSRDDWETALTDVTVTDTDTRLGADGVIGTIPSIPIGSSAELSGCISLIAKDTTTNRTEP